MVDIQCPTALIRRGKKERRKIETTAAQYNGLPITLGGDKKTQAALKTEPYLCVW